MTENELSRDNKETVALQNDVIVVFGTNRDNLDDIGKCETAKYNITIADEDESVKSGSKHVIAINHEYICPVHMCKYEYSHCPYCRICCQSNDVYLCGSYLSSSYARKNSIRHCESENKFGTSNLYDLGPEYDLSYRSWKMLKDRIQKSEKAAK